MSHVQHQTMSVTSWDELMLGECREAFIAIGLPVTGTYKSQDNGYSTFFVLPSGSKAGWAPDICHLELIERAKTILKSYEDEEDGSSCLEYCVSIYGESEG